MLTDALILVTAVLAGALLLHPRLARQRLWQATVTPLASIIGSGFLVIGPIMSHGFGYLAPLAMAGLCALAYGFGGAIRANIAYLANGDWPPASAEARLERAASWTLAFAYVISVAYYLNLFGAFAVRMTGLDSRWHARVVTTMMLIVLLVLGWLRGFDALERLEQITVSFKLAVIASLLAGLAWFFAAQAIQSQLVWPQPREHGWTALPWRWA